VPIFKFSRVGNLWIEYLQGGGGVYLVDLSPRGMSGDADCG